MFEVHHAYSGPFGAVKFSQAMSKANFHGVTSGIAIKYVQEGREDYAVHGDLISVSKGQFILLRDQESYHARSKSSYSNTNGVCIDLDSDFILSHIPELLRWEILFELPFQCNYFSPIGQTFDKLTNSTSSFGAGVDPFELLFHQFKTELSLFAAQIIPLQERIQPEAKKLDTQKHLLAALFKVYDYIHQHHSEPLRLEFLSRLVGVSKYRLIRLFRICFQQSPQQLQVELRMGKAQEMIQRSQCSLTEVAIELGYSDLAAFSNQFKKYYGQAPSDFRKDQQS